LTIDDPEVATALRFIRSHADSTLCVEDALEAVSVGRRSLELRFHRALNRGIWEEIRRVHLERAKALLATTTLSIAAVARSAGYSNYRHLGVEFRQGTGLTPTAYRHRFHNPVARVGVSAQTVGSEAHPALG
jgi:LacI family transcriptional regulator